MEPSKEFIEFIGKFSNQSEMIENVFLLSLIDSFSRVSLIPNIANESEPKIRNSFQHDLFHNNTFTKELLNKRIITLTAENQIINTEREVKRTDIEFIVNSVVRFVVECKKIESVSSTQYITNGISRFINEEYTNENDNFAGMCSFVINDKISKIITGLQERIRNYNYISIDTTTICNYSYSFRSIHYKPNNSEIYIYHLFVNM